ncbi:HD domain-containing protein [Microvirga pudoricolor]|uniref:HD domain-containing protein n=1 Tax=Microvirga pudoricolor TaxID=2778729 RepID=UPI001E4D7D89|nr:HD domain-containing protein [Microvirga pudoricolor]MBM6596434.1 HD domain-containing protein [Microvirga pudoricolor]
MPAFPCFTSGSAVPLDDFAPYQDLAGNLLPHGLDAAGDGSHDLAHLRRVWRSAQRIRAREGGDPVILLAAALLHDCVHVEKNSSLKAEASRRAADKASAVLESIGWEPGRVGQVAHAIAAHSFSAGIEPETLEARILQDADRLDALGAIGVARCFYTAGRMNSLLYDPEDPEARNRPYDDRRYAVDHFRTKLLNLASGFRTEAGAHLARERHERLERFLREFQDEI